MTNVTVVTGAGGALGASVVRGLAAAGHEVIAIDRTPGRVEANGAKVHPLAFDILDPAAWTPALAPLTGQLGAVTGAVLVAGAWSGGGPLHARSDDAIWRAMTTANVDTVHRALRALLPGMVARTRGSIVVVGSRAAARPETSAGAAEYAATKSAVVTLAQAVAAEVLEHGVRVNAILPSTIDTPANRAGMPDADFTRWVSPDALAKVIAFLLSDDAGPISGAAIPTYGRA